MTITKSVQALVSRALREKGISHSQLAGAIGVNPAWVTKFFNGKLLTLSDERIVLIEKFLNIQFTRIVSGGHGIPAEADQLGKLMKERPELVDIVGGLLKLAGSPKEVIHELPHFQTKELTKIGAEISRIVYAWEVPADPHYTKIGLEVVKFLSAFVAKKEGQ